MLLAGIEGRRVPIGRPSILGPLAEIVGPVEVDGEVLGLTDDDPRPFEVVFDDGVSQ